ncbi:MAG: PDDEXK nuclease domain-containing protein [Bacilli bacterium]|nr:PDDEXK nuclease domain-containing protein [Bacilli bacterium]
MDQKFEKWIEGLSENYKKAQIKAAVHVNGELIKFYFELGKEITKTSYKATYGSKFYDILSGELKKRLPNIKGFSARNLYYCEAFYTKYKEILPQLGAKLLLVPWNHHKKIMEKCKGIDEAVFYVELVAESNLSRSELESRISSNAYGRSENTLNNFEKTLPVKDDFKNHLMKDPYNFDFLTIREDYDEKELKDQLTRNIESFLLELGNGFAYVGKEVRLFLGRTEMYCDLLFYNIPNHCYVVIEIKTSSFKPEHMGQLIGYTATIDATLKGEKDNPTIGLLVCRDKDDVLAKHVVNTMNVPLGISEYQLANLIPDKFKSSLPRIEELEELEKN